MYGNLEKAAGKHLEITLEEEMDARRVNTLADGKKPSVELYVDDGRRISRDQRAKIYALINDLCDYTGDVPDEWKERFKFKTQMDFGIDHFSLSDCSVTVANNMILEILDFLFNNEIPFKTKTWDSIPNEFPKQMFCIRHKQCVICGKPAQTAHYYAVGSGRNRNKINHVGMYINTLCDDHHKQQHRLGVEGFANLYHLKPIKVTPEIAKQLKLGRIKKDE